MGPHRRKEELTKETAKEIPIRSERELGEILCSRPNLEVVHEPGTFTIDDKTTLPDFVVVNKKQKRFRRKKIYIEVTGEANVNSNRKQKQKQVMDEIVERNPNMGYVQLSRKELDKIKASAKERRKLR